MINFFNFKQFNESIYLLTNDFGRFCFLNTTDFQTLTNNHADLELEIRKELIDKGFIIEGSVQHFLEAQTNKMRDSKNYIFGATSLHIFVVTNQCNLNCVYCQANNGRKLYKTMTKEIAQKAVDIALSVPQKELSFEFQGGEPLLNYPIIRFIIEYAEKNKEDKTIRYSVVTNLTVISDEMIAFFKDHQVSISTSLDGDSLLHNLNRSYPDGTGSFDAVLSGIKMVKAAELPLGAIQTTTRYSFGHEKELIDTYCDLGFTNIFLRPLSPLGKAKLAWGEIGYTPQEFLHFYQVALSHIIAKNRNGTPFQETYASTLLTKILTGYALNYMELRSPCGAVCGQLAYYTDGNVYSCDEGRMLAEMGTDSFKVGNVFTDSYTDIVKSSVCNVACKSSVLESIPACCDCVYQPYCGVCPAVNLALYNDVLPKSPHHYRCIINKGILDYYFGLLYEQDPCIMSIINHWVL